MNSCRDALRVATPTKRLRPAERLAAFGWSKEDAREFAETFGRVKAPYHGSPPGQKEYRQRKLRRATAETYVRFESHVARKHLLGDEQVATRPPREITNLRFDFDGEPEFREFLKRLGSDRLRIGWMAEPSPGGGGHVEIRVERKSATVWNGVASRLLVALRVFDPQDPQFNPKMSDCVRVATDKVLRLPFFLGRVVLFSDGTRIEIDDPGCARAAWDSYQRLPRHSLKKLERIIDDPPKLTGRPRKHVLIRSHQGDRSRTGSHPGAVYPTRLPQTFSYTCTTETDRTSFGWDPADAPSLRAVRRESTDSGGFAWKDPEGLDCVLARVGSTQGTRFVNGARVVGLLLNAGCPVADLVEAALDVFRRTGSKDAARQPEKVRVWLDNSVVPWVLKERERKGERCQRLARSIANGSAA
jgi:hypothetical protein